MTEGKTENTDKAKVFFERAKKASDSNNYDYAIEMYLEGLRIEPESLEDGHLPLCELALHRLGKGGSKPTMVDKVKHLRGKAPIDKLINAEYLFAKDPENLGYAEAMLKAAVEGQYTKTAGWIANLIFQTSNALEKPSFHTYILLKDSYVKLEKFDKAVAALQHAIKLKPNDRELQVEYKDLSAEQTMASGKYETASDFRQSIKDSEKQAKLYSQDRVVKTESYRAAAVEDAKKEFAANPSLPKNIINLADALSDLQTDEAENSAIQLLENAYHNQRDFTFKRRAGQIKIKQIRRKIRNTKTEFASHPNDAELKTKLQGLIGQLSSLELQHYQGCVQNYPTDLHLKYEYGLRLLYNKKYDEAIPYFQEAKKDPRRKIHAMDKTGVCFFMKGWYSDAIDIFKQALNSHERKDDGIGKELQYNLARTLEENGNTEESLDIYRKIAQMDYAYKDVSQRVDKLRGTKKSE